MSGVGGSRPSAISYFTSLLRAVRLGITDRDEGPLRGRRHPLGHAEAGGPPLDCVRMAAEDVHAAPLAAGYVEGSPRAEEPDIASETEDTYEPDEALLECTVTRIAWEGAPAWCRACGACGEQVYGVVAITKSGDEMHCGCFRRARLRT